MRTQYQVTAVKRGTVERSYRCSSCGLRVVAHVTTEGRGHAQGSRSSLDPASAQRTAAEDFRQRSVDVLGLVACPRCGEKDRVAGKLMVLGLVVATTLTIASAALVWILRDSALLIGPLMIAILAAGYGWRRGALWLGAAQSVEFDMTHVSADATVPLPRAQARSR